MSNGRGTLETIATHLARAFEPLRVAVSDQDQFKNFMYRLGWNVTDLPPEYTQLAASVSEVFDQLESLGDNPDPAAIATLFSKIRELYEQVQGIAAVPAGVAIAEQATFLTELGERLPELLFIDYLGLELPRVYNLLVLLGVIRYEDQPTTESRPGFLRSHLRLERIAEIVREPDRIPEFVYGWGTQEFDFNLVAHHLDQLFSALGFLSRIMPPSSDVAIGYGEPDQEISFLDTELKAPLFFSSVGPIPVEIGFEVLELPGENTNLPGVVFQPLIPEEIGLDFAISEGLSLRIRAGSELGKLFGVLVRPGSISARHPLEPGAAFPNTGFGVFFDFKPVAPALLLGASDTTRVELAEVSTRFELNFIASQLEVILGANLAGLKLVLASKQSDSFAQKIIGDEDVTIDMSLDVVWSNLKGVAFSGGGGFDVELRPNLGLGGVSVNAVQVRLLAPATGPARVNAEIGASITGRLGPLDFVIRGIGLGLTTKFESGNAGLFDIDVGFKPPSGVGLSVDGGGFKGGGFLGFEPEQARYSGMLELEFQDQFTLKAFALLNTRLPNGQSGFSLLIVISAEFTPIQLGLGFKLSGVGGLLGLNRTINIEPLRAGLRDNTLSSILFPTDIVANADRIISDLRQVFPPQEDRFIFGPMAKIAWGTPTLITIDLGLVIEVPEPIRLAILGVLRAALPDENAAILRAQVNFLGEINFERRQLKFDASLFDSKLLGFTLTGDMAIRLDWGADANFLLTVGGFHPTYQPPPMDLPAIRRLTLSLLEGDNPRLKLEMYFAVTSNTAQFGAKLELYAAAWKFNVYGFLTFDALFQFNPFYFIAEITAMLALRVGSSSFASVKLTLTLEGPTPWKAQGTAKFKICWFFTLKVRFNKTFGETRNTTLPDVAVLPLLAAALAANDNWEGELPAQRHRLESIRETPGELLAHPVGTLKVSQKVVPLKVRIDRIGSQRPSDGQQFQIVNVQPAANPLPVQESFAPAQFFDLTDEEKLTSASFKQFESGVRIGDPERLQTDYAAARKVEYELKYIDSQRKQRLADHGRPFEVDVVAFNTWTLQGAIAQSELSFARNRKSSLAPETVAVSQEQFAIVNTGDLRLFDELSLLGNERAAAARLKTLLEANPALRGTLQVVPAFELAA